MGIDTKEARAQVDEERSNEEVKAVILDIDDTLLDTTHLVRQMRDSACCAIISHCLVLDIPKLHDFFLKLHLNSDKLLEAYNTVAKRTGSNYHFHLDELYNELDAASAGISISEWRKDVVIVGVNAYHQTRDVLIRPRKEIADLIEHLKQRGIYTGVVSCGATREKQLDKLDYLDLRRFFTDEDIVVVESDTNSGREQYGDKSKGLVELLSRQGIRPEFAAYVGDSERDNVAANNAGVRFLFYSNPTGKHARAFAEKLKKEDVKPKPEAVVTFFNLDVLKYVDVCNRC